MEKKKMFGFANPVLKAAAILFFSLAVAVMTRNVWKAFETDLDFAALFQQDYQESNELYNGMHNAAYIVAQKELANSFKNQYADFGVEETVNQTVYNIYRRWMEENLNSGQAVKEPVVAMNREGKIYYYFYPAQLKEKIEQSKRKDKETNVLENQDNQELAYGAADVSDEFDLESDYGIYWSYNDSYSSSMPKNLTDDAGVKEFLDTYPQLYSATEKLVRQSQGLFRNSMNQEELEKSLEELCTKEDGFHYVVETSVNTSNKDQERMEQFKEAYKCYLIAYPYENLYVASNSQLYMEEAIRNSFGDIDFSSVQEAVRSGEVTQDKKEALNTGFYIGIPNAVYQERESGWLKKAEAAREYLWNILIAFCFALIAFIYLCLAAGRNGKDSEVHLFFWDRMWSEFTVLGIGTALSFAVCCVIAPADAIMYRDGLPEASPVFAAMMLGAVALTDIAVALFLSLMRHLKARHFLNSFLSLRFCKWCLKGIRGWFHALSALWRGGSITRRALFLAVGLPLICMTWIGAFFLIPALIFIVFQYSEDITLVFDGVKRIRNGDLSHKIKLKHQGTDWWELAQNINEIGQGLGKAVEGELRSERLKTELITNVSHDLKTPLTSIITYVDLLKKEEINNPKALEYIDVIERKAQSLSILSNDLFDAAKASSGDMPVTLERMDLNAILRQALGEYDERIARADLELRLQLSEHPVYVLGDGRLTWRVLSNLLSNVCKYAMAGSRIYIEILENESTNVSFTIKNISAYELNMKAEELLERFKRADESRNTEGSGLGLNIAKSLMELQKGSFSIEVDGDLFKATGTLPKYQAEE